MIAKLLAGTALPLSPLTDKDLALGLDLASLERAHATSELKYRRRS
jgi:hypothetical protein